jgi:hypothetical protein
MFPAPEKIRARDLRIGDQIQNPPATVKSLTRKRAWVHAQRTDGFVEILHQADLIDVIRPVDDEPSIG